MLERADAVPPVSIETDNTVLWIEQVAKQSRRRLVVLPETENRPAVTVVIPAMNEAESLSFVMRLLPEGVETIVVDGNSTDGTVEVARGVRPDVKVIGQSGKGKGDALAHGFDAATGGIIVMLDADGSADPAEIPRFVEALLGGADFAKGTRFAKGGGSADITPIRRAGNRVLTTIVNLLFRTDYTDLCYGYNAFWAHCLPALDVTCDGFEVETLINVRAAKAGLRVAEVGSFEHCRIAGESNLKPVRDGFRILWTITKERLGRRRAARRVRSNLWMVEDPDDLRDAERTLN